VGVAVNEEVVVAAVITNVTLTTCGLPVVPFEVEVIVTLPPG
jgi:hypothetical protein